MVVKRGNGQGQRYVILARGTMNSCLFRFENGYMMVTSRNALGTKVPFNPTVATETVSAALAFAKCDSPQRTACRGAARTVDDGLTPRLRPVRAA
jgi:hypothetical protein